MIEAYYYHKIALKKISLYSLFAEPRTLQNKLLLADLISNLFDLLEAYYLFTHRVMPSLDIDTDPLGLYSCGLVLLEIVIPDDMLVLLLHLLCISSEGFTALPAIERLVAL